MEPRKYTFQIRRFDPTSGEEAHYQEHALGVTEGMIVLE